MLVTGSEDGLVNLYDLHSHTQAGSLDGHSAWVLGCAFAPGDTHFASCGADQTVRTWDIATRKSIQNFDSVHTEQVWGVAFDPRGGRFCSVSDDKTLRLFEAAA
uniref:Uncharacterized protein n=2 Tax=Chrysotila carterae TaxID=13221 RepID=A0A7S4F1T0_CHRCT